MSHCDFSSKLFGSVDAYAFKDRKPWLTMDAPGSSPSYDSNEYDEHNMWNTMLDLFCHERIGAFMVVYFDDFVLGRIALSCHFSLDIFGDKTPHSGTSCLYRFVASYHTVASSFSAVWKWTNLCGIVSEGDFAAPFRV